MSCYPIELVCILFVLCTSCEPSRGYLRRNLDNASIHYEGKDCIPYPWASFIDAWICSLGRSRPRGADEYHRRFVAASLETFDLEHQIRGRVFAWIP